MFETTSWHDLEARAFNAKPLMDTDLHCEFIPTTVSEDCSKSVKSSHSLCSLETSFEQLFGTPAFKEVDSILDNYEKEDSKGKNSNTDVSLDSLENNSVLQALSSKRKDVMLKTALRRCRKFY